MSVRGTAAAGTFVGAAFLCILHCTRFVAAAADPPSTQPQPASQPISAGDMTDPLTVAKAFVNAACEGDIPAATALSVDDEWSRRDGVIASYSANLHWHVIFQDALFNRFKPPANLAPLRNPSSPALREFNHLEAAELDIQGNTARIRIQPDALVLRRHEGRWRVDSRSLYAGCPPKIFDDILAEQVALGETAKAVARDVDAGKYATARDATSAFEARMDVTLTEHSNRIRAKLDPGAKPR